jgi:hypothetical protein
MSELKAPKTDDSVTDFLNAVEHPKRRADGFALLELMSEVTGAGHTGCEGSSMPVHSTAGTALRNPITSVAARGLEGWRSSAETCREVASCAVPLA